MQKAEPFLKIFIMSWYIKRPSFFKVYALRRVGEIVPLMLERVTEEQFKVFSLI